MIKLYNKEFPKKKVVYLITIIGTGTMTCFYNIKNPLQNG